MSNNINLRNAKAAKNDEFYTKREDIEAEAEEYKEELRGKWIYCNCDRDVSEFYKYFKDNFERLGLAHLTATHIHMPYRLDYNGEEEKKTPLTDGDFRGEECKEIMKQADIIVTNPPFSLFRQHIAQLTQYGKKFLIIGNLNAAHYKGVFPLLRDGKMYLGRNKIKAFNTPDGNVAMGNVYWYQNFKRHQVPPMQLTKKYTPEEYPKYDNYDAVEVSRVKDIPMDYEVIKTVTEDELKALIEEGYDVEVIEEIEENEAIQD